MNKLKLTECKICNIDLMLSGYLKGDLVIELPEYWTNLVDPDSITVQLTPIGQSQSLYVDKIEDNIVYIKNENQDREPYCFYFIQAERTDVEKIEVEIG